MEEDLVTRGRETCLFFEVLKVGGSTDLEMIGIPCFLNHIFGLAFLQQAPLAA